MNDELPDGPEYVFAQAVIDRLAGQEKLANYVMPSPFDKGDQVNNLALAVAQYDAAIAVMPQAPQPPPWKGVDAPDPGVVVATAAILVMMTGQVGAVPTIRRLSALTAAVLRRLRKWSPHDCELAGMSPWVAEITGLSTEEVPELINVDGRVIFLSIRETLNP
ncbi:hypothetical protein DMI77_00795 [Akkermansia muciniphila]|uniref:Uncharacterized protein n=1 Tax=Akkermansia massiliensis TaxID=2927224 RepID=A0AAE6TB07_9BACT|nr:hypothetical protein [Akkermansia massiliensis]QHV62001.1 hypothetical protein DMI76_00795 [Akkermansia massiliensis]QHV74368.1 hypothetical protein DMI75_00795 [Akkermansia massiliensis]QUY58324.1 hypothetical protein DMI77_00795 [Akkermansia muciniphila]